MRLVRSAVVVALLLAVGSGAAEAAALLQVQQNFNLGGQLGDRFTWIDSNGTPRVAFLATGAGGGALQQFQYQFGATTRVAGRTQGTPGGWGYVVSHPADEGNCTGNGDSSSLGYFTPSSFQRVWNGRHHAIFRFTQNYPRYCTKAPLAPADHVIPVTIDWTFSTGRDYPLWSVTWDMSAIGADVLEDDARGPYGELLFDGAATDGAHSPIEGVAWGDHYKFTASQAGGVTYNSNWDWTQLNTVPYVKLWTTNPQDATMGSVLTQTITQQDAGGYFGYFSWGLSHPPNGQACGPNDEFPMSLFHYLPCSFNWPYQSINYSMGQAGGADNDVGTNNTRLAWGTNFGFLGQTAYPTNGSDLLGGPFPGATASGYPRKSYAVYVILDLHSLSPVEGKVQQVVRGQGVVITATIGSVVTQGPAGVADPTPKTYQPAGWNHVRGAWALRASGNQVDVNFNAAAGSISLPLIIVSNWTSGLPSSVRLNGSALTQDIGYLPSVGPPGSNELWITLATSFSGATNRLQIEPGTGPPPGAGDTRIITGSGEGADALVRGFTGAGGATALSLVAYPSGYLGGVRVATCDFDGDGLPDLVSAAGPSGAPHVRIVKLDAAGNPGADLANFFAYDPGFVGGLFPACGDVDGDGTPELILGVDAGGGPHVQVFKITPSGPVGFLSFFAYDPGFRGGIRAAAGDVDGSGRASIILGAGPGGAPHVRALRYNSGTGGLDEVASFFAYDLGFLSGIYVAAGDLNGDGKDDIITGVGPGGGPHVQAFTLGAGGAPVSLTSFFAYDPGARAGMRVAAARLNPGDAQAAVLTVPGPGSGAHVKAFQISGGVPSEVTSFFAYDPSFFGGVFIGGAE
jgi:hypothetical protein